MHISRRRRAPRRRRLLTLALGWAALQAHRAQVGGQAVIEGVMMRGVSNWSLAVRRPDDSIGLHSWPLVSWMVRYPILRLPVVRGVVGLVESLVIGIRALTMSANESLGEEEEQLTKKEIGVTLVVAFAFAIALFFLAPLFLTGLMKSWVGTGWGFWVVEGFVRVGIFIAYIIIVTQIPDLRRVFEYHGARAQEHPRPGAWRRTHSRQRLKVQHPAPALRHVVPACRHGRLDLRVRRGGAAGVVLAGTEPGRAGPTHRGHQL
jgi:hypothetical protein